MDKSKPYRFTPAELRLLRSPDFHPAGRYCGNQMCCCGPAGKKPPVLKRAAACRDLKKRSGGGK